jgi:uncharacterized protein (TIRG00374 family)
MIDWVSFGYGASWILGLGLVTASLSYAYYLAGQQKLRFRQTLEIPAYRTLIDLGLAFFCLGWSGSVSTAWERILWIVLAFLFVLQIFHYRKNLPKKGMPGVDEKGIENQPPLDVTPSKRRYLGSWQLWVGVLFSLGFLVLALHDVDLTQTAIVLRHVNLMILACAVVSYVLSTVARAVRWRLLLSAHKAPSFGRSFSVFSVGVMMNAFLPARLGDFARAYLMGEAEADSKVFVLGTVAVEKVIDLLFLLLALIVLLSQMVLPEWLSGSARGMGLILAFLIPCLVLLVWQKKFILRKMEWVSSIFPQAWRDWFVRQTGYGLTSLDVMRQPRLMMGLFGWSLIITIICVLTNYLVFLALGITLPFWASLLLLVMLQVGAAVPASLGRIGVFQYLVILTLAIFAVDKNVALGYSILLYLVVYIPIVLMGSYCLWREKVTWQKIAKAAATLNFLGGKNR